MDKSLLVCCLHGYWTVFYLTRSEAWARAARGEQVLIEQDLTL